MKDWTKQQRTWLGRAYFLSLFGAILIGSAGQDLGFPFWAVLPVLGAWGLIAVELAKRSVRNIKDDK